MMFVIPSLDLEPFFKAPREFLVCLLVGVTHITIAVGLQSMRYRVHVGHSVWVDVLIES